MDLAGYVVNTVLVEGRNVLVPARGSKSRVGHATSGSAA